MAGVFWCGAPAAAASFNDPPRNLIGSSTTLRHVRELYRIAHPDPAAKNATIIEEWRLVQDGQTGQFRVRRTGKDFRETTILGPLEYASGMHAGTRWQQNRNGITFTLAGIHERDAVSERAWMSKDERDVRLIGESVPLNAFVVDIDPPQGRHEWLFIDKKTAQIVRRDQVERNRRVVTTYDDFKPFDGELVPNRVRSVDSLGNERDLTLLSREFDPTPESGDLAIPPTRRNLVEFPAGFAVVRLPIRIINGLLVTRVVIDGRGYDFLLDSGAAGIVVDPLIADTLGLERYGERVGSTIGPFPETTVIIPALSIGLIHMRNVVSRVVPIPFRADDHTHITGLLGFDFFAQAVVHIDMPHGIVEAIHPSVFRASPEFIAQPIALDDKQPALRMKVGPVAARVILDTGANHSVFGAPFTERLDPADWQTQTGSARLSGVGGNGNAEPTRIANIDVGGITLPPAVVDVSAADLGFEDIDGLIGTDLIRDFDLYFEYRTNTVYLRREAHSGQ